MGLIRIGALIAMLGLVGCAGTTLPSAPSSAANSSGLPSVARPAGSSANSESVAGLSGIQPTIASVSPSVVATTGSWGTISGTQIQPGATVTIDGKVVAAVFRDSTTIQFPSAGTHAPGTVDISVTNPGGLRATLPHGLTYAPVESFDVNGEWVGHTDGRHDYEIDMRFTIENNVLVSISCGVPVTMPTTVTAQNGSFSFTGADGLALSGALASTTTSYGQVIAPGCGDGQWWADKVQR